MGVWKGKCLEVKRSRGLDSKPCGHLNVYVSGRLDVHHPCDPPCRRGLALVIARFLFAQNPMKKTSFSYYASPSASQDIICPVQLYKNASPSASQTCLYKFSLLRLLVCVALWLAKFNLRFFSNQLSLNIH